MTLRKQDTVLGDGIIYTFSGLEYDVLNPKKEMVLIDDIAHHLSMECRWGGAVKYFYSVAQHSVLASYLCDSVHSQFEALMHDAHEAYLKDMLRPVKRKFTDYKLLCDTNQAMIAAVFNIREVYSEEVEKIDNFLQVLELNTLINGKKLGDGAYHILHRKFMTHTKLGDDALESWTPAKAKRRFLKRFYKLKSKILLDAAN